MRNIAIATAFILLAGCTSKVSIGPGVSKELADHRSREISEVIYRLSFDIPSCKDSIITAEESISLDLSRIDDIVLDFREEEDHLLELEANGKAVSTQISDEHIIIPRKFLKAGENELSIKFIAGDQSLNRRDELLYTLLVPDRARTLFPCFDQPDMKAGYELTLTIPEEWCAVSNTSVAEESATDGRRTVKFSRTEHLSTYLFSFVAGKFSRYTGGRDGRTVSMYYRETDPQKVSQCPEIIELVMSSLDWLEEYTGIRYPFAKYDFIVLPSFQYGGMEHTGATLYNDRRIFLNADPTTEELLSRASLIAHETSHMWFGDYVTMKWFDDVWTKEVFANWMAAQMARPAFPEVNHALNDLKSYFAPSYSEDRTPGSNAIQRPLDNLSNAGLIYCNIIYDKAPVMMDKLAHRMGLDKFREGVRKYLNEYAYGNATWDDLIECLQPYADFDVAEWSRVWVKEKGMPVYSAEAEGRVLKVSQKDPFENGNVWQQELAYTVISRDGESAEIKVNFTDHDSETAEAPFEIAHILPNTDALGYGCFRLSTEEAAFIRETFSKHEPEARMSLLLSLYDNVWRGYLPADEFAGWASEAIKSESDPLILSSMLSYAATAERMSPSGKLEDALLAMASSPSYSQEARILAFRQLFAISGSPDINARLYEIWKTQTPFSGLRLSETDYTAMSYQLMVRFLERYDEIVAQQRSRITNKDRLEAFDFISKAASPSQEARDSMFQSLLEPQNRRPESSALSAISILNHPLRQKESLKYIRPALEEMPEIQRTGDIFFPSSWSRALLAGHISKEAADEVRGYLENNEEDGQLLLTKVRQSAGLLLTMFNED